MQLPLQVGLVGLCLTFATPLCCAFFKQKAQFSYSRLEPEVKVKLAVLVNCYYFKLIVLYRKLSRNGVKDIPRNTFTTTRACKKFTNNNNYSNTDDLLKDVLFKNVKEQTNHFH